MADLIMAGGRGNTTRRDLHRAAVAKGRPPCWNCGEPIDYSLKYPDPDSFTVEHVIPIAAGGTDTLDNERASHARCNWAKNAKPYAKAIVRRSGALR